MTAFKPEQADFVVRDFAFQSGERLAELRQHYLTLGTPQRDGSGRVTNAVLLLHNTTGSSASWLAPELGGELSARLRRSTSNAIFW
jgi:homoserine O-acetyltransferase